MGATASGGSGPKPAGAGERKPQPRTRFIGRGRPAAIGCAGILIVGSRSNLTARSFTSTGTKPTLTVAGPVDVCQSRRNGRSQPPANRNPRIEDRGLRIED